ncbi:unnamed protein product [Gemmata massiliana]|uniref:Uncharacterized protein n=1 Tax=Gemmata massiliana TaxID=1210884 RepID=A0A6P2D5F7_9BACT|nr:hypothetical protein [Gemmata massiliana]VTR95675.1 unnamed protein product [Gemmata massiliana]
MKWRVLATISVALLATDRVSAQPQVGPPTQRPTISPYLNLLRGGGSTALNYYGLVRPEIQARQSIQNLQGAVTANRQAIDNIDSGGSGNDTSVTGHQAGFLNHGSYFMTGGAGQIGGLGGTNRSAVNNNRAFTNQVRPPGLPGGTGGALGTPPARKK